jgi:hypothetical protein
LSPEPERKTEKYAFTRGSLNVHYLTAPYDLLVAAFGNDGTVSPRDEDRSMASWDVDTPDGEVEVYDYRVGKCEHPDGLERHEITEWHVQGGEEEIAHMLSLLDAADDSLRRSVKSMLYMNHLGLMGRGDA